MTFNTRVAKAEADYYCRIVNHGTEQLAVQHDGTLYPLWPETRTIQFVQLAPVPREVKQFTESIIELQEEMGFPIR
jgi:hypothetical protein